MRLLQWIVSVGCGICIVVAANASPDFRAIHSTAKRKRAFVHYLLPIIQKANQRVLSVRQRLVQIRKSRRRSHRVTSQDAQWLAQIAKTYGVADWDSGRTKSWVDILSRVDVVPPSMVLAQAANESAWGTSRFARLGKNYFGIWCYRPGCGIVPKKRPKGRRYEVQKFHSVAAGMRTYMLHLNAGKSYRQFRQLRSHDRKGQRSLSGAKLIEGLNRYSARGRSYVRIIRSIIVRNHFGQFDHA